MPEMHIVLDVEQHGFSSLRGLASPRQLIHLNGTAPIEVGALAGGMQSGDPSAAFCFRLPDHRVVLVETSLRLFLTAADALKARYGDPRMADLGMPDITLPPDVPPLAMVRAVRALATAALDSVSGEAFDKLTAIARAIEAVEQLVEQEGSS